MVISRGFVYRLGQRIKDTGELMGQVKLLGIPILRPFCGLVIGIGLGIRNSVFDCPIGEM